MDRVTQRTCPVPGCGKTIVLSGGSLKAHFKEAHPQFEFSYAKMQKGKGKPWYELVCDKCGVHARTFDVLVKEHGVCGAKKGSITAELGETTELTHENKRPKKKQPHQRTCPVPKCGEMIRSGGRSLRQHMWDCHPEYKFEIKNIYGNDRKFCSVCDQELKSFVDLVKNHAHKDGAPVKKRKIVEKATDKGIKAGLDMIEEEPKQFETLSQTAIRLLEDFSIAFKAVMEDYDKLRGENKELREKEGSISNALSTITDGIEDVMSKVKKEVTSIFK